jgi:CRISPR system Cascade subunit CasE
MMLYLSRLRLKRTASVAILVPILWPNDVRRRAGVGHRLIWSLFPGDPTAKRDFLWREETPGGSPRRGLYYVLSKREPHDALGIFDLETKLFDPQLAAGDRLGFVLRANPTIAVKRITKPRARGKRLDVVMAALLDTPRGRRASLRGDAIQEAGKGWLVRQGSRAGFDLVDAVMDGYSVRRIERNGGKPIEFAVLDASGVVTVTDPAAFLAALSHGFGSAKSFGCGLMMIRRARGDSA